MVWEPWLGGWFISGRGLKISTTTHRGDHGGCHDGFDLQMGRASRASMNGRHVLELRLNPAAWLKSMPEKFCPTSLHSINFEYHQCYGRFHCTVNGVAECANRLLSERITAMLDESVDIESLCTLVVLCGAFAVITSAVSFPG